MLTIKLKQIGKKHERPFRVIVQEKKTKLDGRLVEDVGWYNPKTNKSELKSERVSYWLGVGARPTVTVHQLIKRNSKGRS